MPDREKVIRGLECLADVGGCKYKYCLHCAYREDVDHCAWNCHEQDILRDALELLKASGWISVKDRLPDEPGWYMVYAPTYRGGSSTSRENHDGIMFAKWSGKNWSVERCYYNRPGCVEKWMPLPEPPKEGT